MARRRTRERVAAGTAPRARRDDRRPADPEVGLLPQLARAARHVEAAARRGPLTPRDRARFQAIALLVREERARVRSAPDLTEGQHRVLRRLDGVGTILAETAARDTSVLRLLADDAPVSESARDLTHEMLRAAGMDPPPSSPAATPPDLGAGVPERQVVPQSVVSRQLANPFLAPDFAAATASRPVASRLASWELLGPLFRAFEEGGDSACMRLPEPGDLSVAGGGLLMPHQAQVVRAAGNGHRTFLLADEPGLGKTAQALLAAAAADAYPLLVVVPNVVKTSWAREAELWTPSRSVTVVHGDGRDVDGFADIVVVNYDVLDRHVGWLGGHGFGGMVVDEAHFIKNVRSQRSRHVLHLVDRLRSRTREPLVMALTGTPLINDVKDFRAIWQLLGWIDDEKLQAGLMSALERTGLTPADRGFYPAARSAVVEMGIVRRRKVDVVADIPARRIADVPVELEGAAGRSVRAAERDLARRLVSRYDSALAARAAVRAAGTGDDTDHEIDHELVRRVAVRERQEAVQSEAGGNVFGLMREIGTAKAELAADYAAQLSRSAGKVVFFAKHVAVMDTAERLFASRGIRFASIRGDQTRTARQRSVDAFVTDPEVTIAVCSLAVAGVGINLQVASNVVLAELSWTDAEQTQAIDRVHRIGQTEPVTAWRVVAAQTLDARIAELVGAKAGLAARALDGSDEEVADAAAIQLEALVTMLTDGLSRRGSRRGSRAGDDGP